MVECSRSELGKNLYRSIILAKGGRYWVYAYLFAKQDVANINNAELAGFRKLANDYAALKAEDVDHLIREHDWFEICIDYGEEI